MNDADVARMIVEGLAYQLSALPDSVWEHAKQGGCNAGIVGGLLAARNAFHQHATENDIAALKQSVEDDVVSGLAALDAHRG